MREPGQSARINLAYVDRQSAKKRFDKKKKKNGIIKIRS